MPPHCDTMDGPVVAAAKKALEEENVNLILPWAAAEAEAEISHAFEKTMSVRKLGNEARELADYWFFETVVRLHRAGEGASYTGLKPAGMDVGPVVPRAEKAIESSDPTEVIGFIQDVLARELHERFQNAISRKGHDPDDVDAARAYVQAMLSFMLFSHHLYEYITAGEIHGE